MSDPEHWHWRTWLRGSIWLLVEKVWLLLSSLVIGIWIVRSLDPGEYGALSLAFSITSVFAAVATVGLDSAVLHLVASQPTRSRDVYLASIGLRVLGAAAHLGLCALVAGALFSDSSGVILMTLIAGSAAIFRIFDAATLQWQADQQFSAAVGTRVAARVAGDVARIALILVGAGAPWFAAAVVLEAIIGGALLLYRTRPHIRDVFRASKNLSSQLLAQGIPVILSGLMSACYARFDQVAISRALGPEANGTYAAAVRISEIFSVLAVAIGSVALPRLSTLAARTDLEVHLVRYMRAMVLIGAAIAASVSFFAEDVIRVLYGAKYEGAAPILMAHAWTVPLIFASVAAEPWFYIQGRVSLYVSKTMIGLLICVPAVVLAIPTLGAPGVAATVVLTYFFSALMTNLFIPAARPLWWLQLEALLGRRFGRRV